MRYKSIDLIGQVFGYRTVVRKLGLDKWRSVRWKVRCACGSLGSLTAHALRQGKSLSCGCRAVYSKTGSEHPNYENLLGRRFGRLIVLEELSERRHGKIYWKVACDCGNTTALCSSALLRGKTKSCRCPGRHIGNKNPRFKGYKDIGSTYFNRSKNHSAKIGREFSITIEYVADLLESQKHCCALSGLPIKMGDGETTASLDRIDSALGYVVGNVQWLHKDVNHLKWNLPQSGFIELCRRITEHTGVSKNEHV
jgi:hypothetical protein